MEDFIGLVIFGGIALVSAILKARGEKAEKSPSPRAPRRRVVQQTPQTQMSPELARAYNMAADERDIDVDVEPLGQVVEQSIEEFYRENVSHQKEVVEHFVQPAPSSHAVLGMIKNDPRNAIIMSEILGTPKGML